MADRYDNLSLEELLARDIELQQETNSLRVAIRERMLSACQVKIGRAYVIRSFNGCLPFGRDLTGRIMLVSAIFPYCMTIWSRNREPAWVLKAEGFLKRPSPDPRKCGHLEGRYASRSEVILAARLDLSTECEP